MEDGLKRGDTEKGLELGSDGRRRQNPRKKGNGSEDA